MNDYFRFKQFTVRQGQTAMKVGTDGVLLGAWAAVETATSILDIGTGTGLIALMAAQRNPSARIEAVEINPQAYHQACDNIRKSPWPGRIQVHLTSVFDYQPGFLFDSIICNPPFFVGSTPAPDAGRTTARHCHDLRHTDLLILARKLLSPQGCLNLILPAAEAELLQKQTPAYSARLSRLTYVLPNPGKQPKRCLMQFVFYPAPTQTDQIVLEYARHQYSPEYINLTQNFYLNL